MDALTSGNMLAHGPLTNPLSIVAGNAPVFQIGEITVSVVELVWSDYLANAMLDHLFGGSTFTQPAAVYLGFSTSAPALDGTNITEPSGSGYARTQVTSFNAASGGTKTNAAQIQFPQASGAWGNIAYGVLYDAATSGNFLGQGAVANPYSVVSGNAPLVLPGQFSLTAA